MQKTQLRLPALIVLGICALHGCVLAPLYEYIINDVVLTATLWLDVIEPIRYLADIGGTAALFAFLIHAVYRYDLRGARPMLLFACGAVAFKHLSTIITISIVNGSVNLTGGLTEYLFSFLLELSLCALCVLLAKLWVLPAVQFYAQRKAAAEVLRKDFEEGDGCYPFRKLFSYQNPLQRTVFWSLLILILVHSAAYFIGFFSVPLPMSASDIPVMLIYWLLLVLLPGALSYFLALFCIKQAERALAQSPSIE